MAKKEFTFRGKTVEELQAMGNEEFAKLLNARGRRSLLRGTDPKIEKKIIKALAAKGQGKEQKPIRTHGRDVIVTPKMLGIRFAIHKGNSFEIVEIIPQMLGHYFGELVLTRKRLIHGKAGIGATKSSTALATKKV